MPAAIVRSAATLGLERVMLLSLALAASLVACQEPDQATGPSLSQAALPNSITLTYICGNSFRVRNTNGAAVTVTWDVYQKGETGTLVLPPKPASAPYSETYFTTVNKGTVRLFLDGALIQTKANGNKPVCQLPVDTTKPAIPTTGSFDFPRDTTVVVAVPGDTITVYYRNIFKIRFEDSTSGTTIRAYLLANQGEIIGGAPNTGAYIVRVPDPGPSYQAFDSLRSKLNSTPAVSYAAPAVRRSGYSVQSRFPNDGPGASRAAWLGTPTPYTRPRLDIRAPLAWGCETGLYGGASPSVGVVDFFLDADFPGAGFGVSRVEPDSAQIPLASTSPLGSPKVHSHGTGVSGILVGRGDDTLGVAGMVWNAHFTFFSLSTGGKIPDDLGHYLAEVVLPQAAQRGVRVLVSSVFLGNARPEDRKEIERGLAIYTASGGLFVQATGDEASRYSPEALIALNVSSDLGLIQAVASLFQSSASARNGLLVVGGTDDTGGFWKKNATEGSNFFDGITEILAPATNITTLAAEGDVGPGIGGGLQTQDGTSLSAPFVGGVAALLLAMDPSLRADQLKDYLIRGSAMQRENANTGALTDPPNPHAPSGNVHQLDAYGSLKLLSFENPNGGTPLCGLIITNTGNAYYQTQSTILRTGPEPVVVAGQPVAFTSVAQGGRLAASGPQKYRLSSGGWVEAGSAGESAVIFLEEDTAYARAVTTQDSTSYRTDLWVRIGSPIASRNVDHNVTAGFPSDEKGGVLYSGSAGYAPEKVSISPTGDWVYVEFGWSFNDDCLSRDEEGKDSRSLIALNGGQSKELSARSWRLNCQTSTWTGDSTSAAGGRIAWSGDGGEFYYGREYYNAETQLERWTVENGIQQLGSGVGVGMSTFDALVWSGEGGRLLSIERSLSWEPPSYCYERVRAAERPGTVVSEVWKGDYYTGCPTVPVAALKMVTRPTPKSAPGMKPRQPVNPRYPLGIPVSMRAN